jgi:DNA uptake protein ComE-like DNA-binding protein
MGADRTTEGNRSGTGATGQNGTGNAPETSTSPSEPTGSDARNSFGAVDINRAEFDELVSLKHIGRSRAKRIMSNRPFRSLEDLASQGIVPADTLAQLRDRLTV